MCSSVTHTYHVISQQKIHLNVWKPITCENEWKHNIHAVDYSLSAVSYIIHCWSKHIILVLNIFKIYYTKLSSIFLLDFFFLMCPELMNWGGEYWVSLMKENVKIRSSSLKDESHEAWKEYNSYYYIITQCCFTLWQWTMWHWIWNYDVWYSDNHKGQDKNNLICQNRSVF